MKHSFLILFLCLLGCTPSQKEARIVHQEELRNSHVEFTIKTDLGADVEMAFYVYYRGKHDFHDTENAQNKNIHKVIIDSLRQFNVYEMYAIKRSSMDSITRNIVENEFKKGPIKIERVELGMIEIPKKDKERFWRNEELKNQIYKAIQEVYEKKAVLKQKLKSAKNLSKTERVAIEIELSILDKEMGSLRLEKQELILE
jgi:hypothetical protein